MATFSRMIPVVAGLIWTATIPAAGDETVHAPAADANDVVFGFDKLHKLHLTMSATEWEAMQPAGAPGFGGFPGFRGQRQEPAPSVQGNRPTHRGNMVEYPVSYGDLAENGTTYRNVAVRYKGNFTYMASARSLKRSLKIDFEPPGTNAPKFHGLSKINLHAGVLDPTRQREALSYEVFRAAGVPAPRTGYAELALTVGGKYDREFVGLYVLVEQVDKRFLKNWFTNATGVLFKPQGVRGPEYLGDRWEPYESRYRPNRTPSREEAERVIAFAKLVGHADEQDFSHQIDSFLDIDGFLRFLAANAMLVNLDSPLAMPQNYYVYLHSDSGRFTFMPWDLDLSLAAWPMGGPPEKQMDLSLMHPHAGEHKLIDRLLAIPAIRGRYKAILTELAGGAFAKARLLGNIALIEKTTRESLAKEAKAVAARHEPSGFGSAPAVTARAPSPRVFVEQRVESIQAQLAGARPGYTPALGGFLRAPGRAGPPVQQP